jgi:excinuclease ABC subunit A
MTTDRHLTILLRSIGHAVNDGVFIKIALSPDAVSGLKELHYFSHIYLFLDDHGDAVVHLCRILLIDEGKGHLLVYPSLPYISMPVFDIKPYIPVDDRVAQPISPELVDGSMHWFLEWNAPILADSLQSWNTVVPNASMTAEWSSIGLYSKRGTRGLIHFHISCQDVINKIRGYSHLKVLWVFNRFLDKKYRQTYHVHPPYPGASVVGVFASRSPVRPNPVAMTTVRVINVDRTREEIEISGLEAYDRTPVLALIPYDPCHERVRSFIVPPWMAHWPDWHQEDNSCKKGPAKVLKQSHSAALMSIIGQEKHPLSDPDLFWKRADKVGEKVEYDDFIRITGACQNNLKNLSVAIPKNKFTVITGMSGSGKSSLAFDTLYAESQRRFVDTLSTLGRQAFGDIERPDVEGISGLPYAIAIEQKSIGRNARSYVGTVTEIFDYLRLLYSRIAKRYCPDCGEEIAPLSAEDLAYTIKRLARVTDFTINDYKTGDLLMEVKSSEGLQAERQTEGPSQNGLLHDRIRRILSEANHTVRIIVGGGDGYVLSSHPLCPQCDRIFFQMTSSYFSFNHPDGMCPECKGLGKIFEVDPERIVTRPDLSLLDGASPWWGDLRSVVKNPSMNWMRTEVLALGQHYGIDLECPWNDLSEEFRQKALYGTGDEKLKYYYDSKTTGRSGVTERPVYGAVNHIKRLFDDRSSDAAQGGWSRFLSEKECSLCDGERLSAEGRMATLAGLRYPEVAGKSIGTLKDWIEHLPVDLDDQMLLLTGGLLTEIRRRCLLLIDAGLAYLSLDRPSSTLSGGEAQRIRLAGQLGCGLNNLLYVLDEPSMGLHVRDHLRMLKTIKDLKEEGNTVVVVEHDPETMQASDFIIDMGPGAGFYGGEIVASGSPQEIAENPISLTGAYLSGRKKVFSSELNRAFAPYGWLRIHGALKNNLKDVTVSIPLGCITAITGVSGSGKSTLVHQVLCPSLKELMESGSGKPCFCNDVLGIEWIDKVITVDQSPIGRTPRSNPASYTGLWDGVRTLFASTYEAKNRAFGPDRFSFNNKNGACPACQGDGRMRTEMHFMPDVWSVCPQCMGKRFRQETLEILWNGSNVAEILDMEIASAMSFLSGQKKVHRILKTLNDVGLGYLRLGQSALDLSGGEAQRVKLAKELCRPATGRTLYVLDEPTTGLHFEDIRHLLNLLFRLRDEGNTILFVEHNLDLIGAADYVVDLGPEGGDAGGYVVVQGTIEEVMNTPESYTGCYLKKMIDRYQS